MKKVIIVTYSYWNFKEAKIGIGGLETYLNDLINLMSRSGYECIVHQLTDCTEYTDVTLDKVKICPVFFKKICHSAYQKMFNRAFLLHDSKDTVFVIATDQMNIRSRARNVIAIQHGISWDMPYSMIRGFWGKCRFLCRLNKYIRCYVNSRRHAYVRNLVCVDYNYFNWLRTLVDISPEHNVIVIPNYTSSIITPDELEIKLQSSNCVRNIVFARRFVDYRGTLMFAAVAGRLLEEYPDLKITFAGNGPLEPLLIDKFGTHDRVSITSFETKDSVRFHYGYDIAVVPTIFSEGTSLSLCEAMSAGCLPVATHVGGMTNMIIDGFNGLMCPIGEEELYNAITKAISLSHSERNFMIRNAYHTACYGFSKAKWERGWIHLLNKL